MDEYVVKLYTRAYRDIDNIYLYIAENLLAPDAALNMVDELEKAIFSLGKFPERGAIRRTGVYANDNYRQLFVKNYMQKKSRSWHRSSKKILNFRGCLGSLFSVH